MRPIRIVGGLAFRTGDCPLEDIRKADLTISVGHGPVTSGDLKTD